MKYIKGIIQLIVASILAVLVLPIGFLWGWIGKPIYEVIKGRYNLKKALTHFGKYFIKFIYQIYKVIERLAHYLALVIDLTGNAIAGELFEDIVTSEEDTLFGEGDCSISSAMGELEVNNKKITKAGRLFSKMLNWTFRVNSHCTDAYKAYQEWKDSKS